MLAGVPIVSTSVGGVPEVLQHGRAGVLVPASSASDLADGIDKLIIDSSAAMRMSAIGKELVMNWYSTRSMAVKYNSVYEKLRLEA
jgi:glycosyltransferase involved in cell wall biosynthesis